MNIHLKDLAAALQEAVMEADRQAFKTQHTLIEEAAGNTIDGLPGSPSELSLMAPSQMALSRWRQEWPCKISIDDNGKVLIGPGEGGMVEMVFERGEQSEVVARYRDKEVERLVFSNFTEKDGENG